MGKEAAAHNAAVTKDFCDLVRKGNEHTPTGSYVAVRYGGVRLIAAVEHTEAAVELTALLVRLGGEWQAPQAKAAAG